MSNGSGINPYIDLFGAGQGYQSAGGGGGPLNPSSLGGGIGGILSSLFSGGGGALSSLGFPVIMALLNQLGLFGGGDDEEVRRKQQEMEMQKYMQMVKPQYPAGAYQVNPKMFQGMNEATSQAVLNHLARMTNWGFPKGMELDTDYLTTLANQLPALTSASPGGRVRTRPA